jgi:DEAD/DEAH box helicase domain-containing protein
VQPLIVAEQTRQGVADFLKTTFPATTRGFETLMADFLDAPGNLAKGPYLTIGLPFKAAPSGLPAFPWAETFRPHAHQARGFGRLVGGSARSTLVATGTGSGKTECFLFPVLEHCRQMRAAGRRGIKAILIYPMNALATDQANRLAKEIVTHKALSGITAGLYVGDESDDKSTTVRHVAGDRYTVITDRDRIREEPPDILLTNYKMLDFLLLRARDAHLWRHNEPDTLRYLVVDELHAYDGAQGTDLGCLIRRLKARLRMPSGAMVCVGTSATLGAEGNDRLLTFAHEVFGEEFDATAVIGEERESVAEYLRDNSVEFIGMPKAADASALSHFSYASADDFIASQYRLWFEASIDARNVDTLEFRIQLGKQLKQHVAFQNLLRDLHKLGGRAVALEDLVDVMRQRLRDAEGAPPDYPRLWLGSLLALIAHASKETNGARREPLLSVRIELWLRELRRMVATLSDQPTLIHSDDITANDKRVLLPLIHCRDCHAMGWGATQTATDGAKLKSDLREFYAAFFGEDTATRFIFPADDATPPNPLKFERRRACIECGVVNTLESSECTHCGCEKLLLVDIARNLKHGRRNGAPLTKSHHDCPYCEGDRTLTIVGSQAASLASVGVGQLFGTKYNTDKKLIAFSDSVQDAAHRAGFFEARNWRLNLRPALAQVIHAAAAASKPLTLAQLPEAFEERWLPEFGDRRYVRTFLSPSLTWLRDYQSMIDQDTAPTDYVKQLTRRGLVWAMVGEFGQDAHVGRTLPRTLTAAVAFDADALAAAIGASADHLREKIEALRDVTHEEVHDFIVGVLWRLQRIGAIWDERLEDYARRGCNIYAYRNNPAEFALLKTPRRPRYLALVPFQKCDTVMGDDAVFYKDWLFKSFEGLRRQAFGDDTVIADVYRIVLESLAHSDVGITRSIDAERAGTRIWGIEPSACLLMPSGKQWRCKVCRNTVVSEPELNLADALCRQIGCQGTYARHEFGDPEFYRQLYLSADVHRILAQEHTGLLDRTTRERVESDFKEAKTNVLSATPTLEMGIDIGDLSAVMLCSVPPAQANYVQRIGRAGRKTGNAFLPMLATGRPHDLYFWAQPREMLAGDVDAPGVFLNASAVLERQLTAFTIDCWVRKIGEQARIPHKLSDVLSAVRSTTQSKFPYTWFAFIAEHQATLLVEFIELFKRNDGGLRQETIEHLERFLAGAESAETAMRWKVVNGLSKVVRDLDDLKKRRERVEKEVARIDALPARGESDLEELEELKLERAALTRLMASISSRDTYQFFTDEGLIPNYAFPEQGVLLHSVIVRDDRKASDESRVLTFEYERPGASAITDLAPNSVFYAEGRRVTIDQVDVTHDHPAPWRFCRSCSYANNEETAPSQRSSCPRCGDTLWSDSGRVQKMMRLTKVYARTFESRSRIGDDSDDRERRFFVRQALVDVPPEAIRQAWAIDNAELPFAFEFASRISFREVNFGEQTGDGQPIQIAGDESRKPGFAICPECGTVQRRRRDDEGWKNHALYCSKRRQSDTETDECIFLYREFDSEGIRTYLPESSIADSEVGVHSFIAALQMGLELKFQGSVDHLRIARDIRIAQGQEVPRQYLVIYDSVPGGTGYLKELMRDAAPMFEVFKLALKALNECACNSDEHKDGCYRCVYTYHNSYDRKNVSRRTAVKILTQIVQHEGSLKPVRTIGEVVQQNALFDSELERRFIEALRRRVGDTTGRLEVKEEVVRGKPGYFLKAGDLSWTIEPQVSLGPDHGVMIPCKPDFVLWPETAVGYMPIAVFLDGWQYHKDRIGDDIAKRMAVARSGKFSVWTLTSDDISHVLQPTAAAPETLWASAFRQTQDHAAPLYDRLGIANRKSFHSFTAFEQLRARIAGLNDTTAARLAVALALRVGADKLEAAAFESLKKSAGHEALALTQVFEWPSQPDVGRCWTSAKEQIQIGLQSKREDLARLPGDLTDRSVQPCIVLRWADVVHEADGDVRRLWQQWWHAVNLLLPAANFWMCADVGCELGALKDSPAYKQGKMSVDWEAAASVAAASVQPLLAALFAEGVTAPIVGYELANNAGCIIGDAELGWPSAKVAVLINKDFDAEFRAAGWTVLSVDMEGLAAVLIKLLK